MTVVSLPQFLRRASKPAPEPAPNWDPELEAMQKIWEWIVMLPSEEAQLRVLSYCMWRLKSGDTNRIGDWVSAIAEESVVEVSKRAGFRGGVE